MSRAWPALERQRSEQSGFRVNTEQDLSCKTTETDWEHGEEDGRDTGSVARSAMGRAELEMQILGSQRSLCHQLIPTNCWVPWR